MPIHGYAACNPKQPLRPFTYESGELRAHDLDVHVEYCGICHSDIHLIDNDWGMSQYPFIPGHEIVGSVIAAGKEITHVQLGQSPLSHGPQSIAWT